MTDYITHNGELVCEHCMIDPTPEEEICTDNLEMDSPANCSYCNRPIDCTLTDDGIKYVYETIRQDLKQGLNYRSDYRWDHGYYIGLGMHACTRDWAELLLEHNPNKKIKRVAEYYLYHTRNMP